MAKLSGLTEEELRKASKEAFSAAETCRILQLCDNGGNITRLKKQIQKFNIDISHWTGQLWSKGKTAIEDKRLFRDKDPQEVFTENSNVSSTYVRKIIKQKGLKEYRCSICPNDGNWNGKPLNLQLDHINGNRKDQRLENLRWVCPNCHSQTDTYGGKNISHTGKKKVSDEQLLTAIKETDNIYQALKKVNLENGRNYARAKKLKNKLGE